MRESIKVRVTSVLERAALSENVNNVAVLIARYVCREIGSREYRKKIRLLFADHPNVQDELISLKGNLDYSSLKNSFLRAIHVLANLKKPNRSSVVKASRLFNIDCDDLDFFYQSLPLSDLSKISDLALSNDGYSDEDIIAITKQIEYLLRSLVYRRLSFVLNNDAMIETPEDLISPLRIAAVKIIREYEIQDITYEHMLNKVIKGVQNKARNMAEKYGRGKRQPIKRVNPVDPHRILWHFDISSDRIYKVKAFQDPTLRRKVDRGVCILVQDAETDDWIAVYHKRLYATKQEALAAQLRKKNGKRSKRDVYVDLAPQQMDDFQPSTISMDNDESEITLHDCLPSNQRVDAPELLRRMRQLLHGLPPRTREFAELVFASDVDELFSAWCSDNGYNLTACDDAQLGRIACKYLDLSKTQLKIDLASSSTQLWSSWERKMILQGINHLPK